MLLSRRQLGLNQAVRSARQTCAPFRGHDDRPAGIGRQDGAVEWQGIVALSAFPKRVAPCAAEPFAYLKANLTAIANGHPQKRIEALLLWNFNASS